LDAVFTSEFDITVIHPGVAPSELIKPAGHATIGYRSIHDGMLTQCNLLTTNEI
jgi:hypothetical protein